MSKQPTPGQVAERLSNDEIADIIAIHFRGVPLPRGEFVRVRDFARAVLAEGARAAPHPEPAAWDYRDPKNARRLADYTSGWNDARAAPSAHPEPRREEILRIERDHAKAMYDRTVKILVGIHALLYPRTVEHDGKTYRFKSPIVEEQMQVLSDAIRAIPDELAADPAHPGPAGVVVGHFGQVKWSLYIPHDGTKLYAAPSAHPEPRPGSVHQGGAAAETAE